MPSAAAWVGCDEVQTKGVVTMAEKRMMTRAERHADRRAKGWRLVGYRPKASGPDCSDGLFRMDMTIRLVSVWRRPKPKAAERTLGEVAWVAYWNGQTVDGLTWTTIHGDARRSNHRAALAVAEEFARRLRAAMGEYGAIGWAWPIDAVLAEARKEAGL